MERLYLDHNATTPLRAEARAEYLRELDRLGGNPSSVHTSGRAARVVLDLARERAAAALGVHEDELVFTSGGTESVHLALLGALKVAPAGGLVTTVVEHSAVLGAAELAGTMGRPVAHVGVDAAGRVDLAQLVSRARDGAALVSLQTANNEVGTVHPVGKLVAELETRGERPLVHTDAVQALGRVPVELRAWRVDLASFSAHKLGGPLGVGLLYKRKGVRLAPLLVGGGQEGGLRPGTENVPAIAAAACALELAVAERAQQAVAWRASTSELWRQLQSKVPDVQLNGPEIDASDRLPNTLNVTLPGSDGRTLVARLDLEGLEVSAGSACASGSLEPSHVLLAMGRSPEAARAGLRLSLGRTTRGEDVHKAVEILSRIRHALR
ncbi:MAG: cysteine desulfurase family protein [Planctomycetota bacterium]